jgi:hypothetical protein
MPTRPSSTCMVRTTRASVPFRRSLVQEQDRRSKSLGSSVEISGTPIGTATVTGWSHFTISTARTTKASLLAIIGPAWLTAIDERGNRRLDDRDDIVRLEVEAALARSVRVIPILVEGAVMPGRQDLPESLPGLARRHALLIRHESFRSDAGRLVGAIERILAPAPGTAAVPSLPAAHSVRSAENVLGGVTQTDSGPARNDADRGAARLLTEAERNASSITDEPSKAAALSGVALAASPGAADPRTCGEALCEDAAWRPVRGHRTPCASHTPQRAQRGRPTGPPRQEPCSAGKSPAADRGRGRAVRDRGNSAAPESCQRTPERRPLGSRAGPRASPR